MKMYERIWLENFRKIDCHNSPKWRLKIQDNLIDKYWKLRCIWWAMIGKQGIEKAKFEPQNINLVLWIIYNNLSSHESSWKTDCKDSTTGHCQVWVPMSLMPCSIFLSLSWIFTCFRGPWWSVLMMRSKGQCRIMFARLCCSFRYCSIILGYVFDRCWTGQFISSQIPPPPRSTPK